MVPSSPFQLTPAVQVIVNILTDSCGGSRCSINVDSLYVRVWNVGGCSEECSLW